MGVCSLPFPRHLRLTRRRSSFPPLFFAVVGADGSFFKANFEKGGEAVRVAYAQFVKAGTQQLPPSSSLGGAVGLGLAPGSGGPHGLDDDGMLATA